MGSNPSQSPVSTTPFLTGGASAQRLVSPRRGACAQRLGALCAVPCMTRQGPVRNALCHGKACAHRLVSRNALFHWGGACAQRLVSRGGGLCTAPCVTEGGACARRLVSRVPVHNALCHRRGPDLTILAEPRMTASYLYTACETFMLLAYIQKINLYTLNHEAIL